MNIKRYEFRRDTPTNDCECEMKETKNGFFVQYDDVKHLVEGRILQSNNACNYCVNTKRSRKYCTKCLFNDFEYFIGIKAIIEKVGKS